METRLVSISHKQCRNGVLKRNDWVQLGLLKISKSSGEQSIFIRCSLRAAVETSWIVHVLFIPPLLLLAPGWIFDISPWAICSPVAGECEVEENRGFWGSEHPRVLSRCSQEPWEQVPNTREVMLVGFGQVCPCGTSGTFSYCPTQSAPLGFPHRALDLEQQAGPRLARPPLLHTDALETFRIRRQGSLGTVLFSPSASCRGDLFVHLCAGAEKR